MVPTNVVELALRHQTRLAILCIVASKRQPSLKGCSNLMMSSAVLPTVATALPIASTAIASVFLIALPFRLHHLYRADIKALPTWIGPAKAVYNSMLNILQGS